jgi:hypothetical protein
MTCCATAGAVITTNAAAAPKSLYLAIGFLLVKVLMVKTPAMAPHSPVLVTHP